MINRFLKTLAIVILVVSLFVSQITKANTVASVFEKMCDVDLDKTVTIADATMIQRDLADLTKLNRLQSVIGDINQNGKIDILDATIIQRELADIKTEYRDVFYDYLYYYVEITDCRLSPMGEIPVGTPVELTASANTIESMKPLTYEYRIKNEIIRQRSENPTLIYTFDRAGTYSIDLYVYNEGNALDTRRIVIIVK